MPETPPPGPKTAGPAPSLFARGVKPATSILMEVAVDVARVPKNAAIIAGAELWTQGVLAQDPALAADALRWHLRSMGPEHVAAVAEKLAEMGLADVAERAGLAAAGESPEAGGPEVTARR